MEFPQGGIVDVGIGPEIILPTREFSNFSNRIINRSVEAEILPQHRVVPFSGELLFAQKPIPVEFEIVQKLRELPSGE